jgi:hypothetical protein
VTESEWLVCTGRPRGMITFLRQNYPLLVRPWYRRKLRLFACQGCRRLLNLLKPELDDRVLASFDILPVAERYAEGRANHQELRKARQRIDSSRQENPRPFHVWHALTAVTLRNSWDAAEEMLNAGYWEALNGLESEDGYLQHWCGAVRDVFGQPFAPLLSQRSFPAAILGLARSCEEGDHALYPVLADALQDQGEGEAARHCREEPIHFHGCHIVDWVLGKGR